MSVYQNIAEVNQTICESKGQILGRKKKFQMSIMYQPAYDHSKSYGNPTIIPKVEELEEFTVLIFTKA